MKESNFGEWLKTQPDSFIVECLGPENASRFKSGDLKLKSFKELTGKTYDFDDLRRLEAQAFEPRPESL